MTTHPTYAEVDICWNETVKAIDDLIAAEKRAAADELNSRVKALSDAANVARMGVHLLGGVAGTALDAATQKFSGALDAVAGAVTGRDSTMAAGDQKIAKLRALIRDNGSWLSTRAARAAQTPEIFSDLAKRWSDMAQETEELRDDIRTRGLNPAWVSQASSANYTEAVNTQLSALGELGKAATNHASSCRNVGTAQKDIFNMIWHRLDDCKKAAEKQTLASATSAKEGNFFAGVAAMIEKLNFLYSYLTSNGGSTWPVIGLQIGSFMEASVESAEVLSDGWPSRSTHSDAEQDPDKMVTVSARN